MTRAPSVEDGTYFVSLDSLSKDLVCMRSRNVFFALYTTDLVRVDDIDPFDPVSNCGGAEDEAGARCRTRRGDLHVLLVPPRGMCTTRGVPAGPRSSARRGALSSRMAEGSCSSTPDDVLASVEDQEEGDGLREARVPRAVDVGAAVPRRSARRAR